MADSEVHWAPIYVLGAGYKKLNGAYIGAGNYAGRLRYKHPKELIWCFFNEEKQQWIFSNKSRYLEDGKTLYKNKHNTDDSDPIPMRGWKYHQSPGTNPPPKVINSAFVAEEVVDIYSKKAKKWIEGKINKVNEKGTYKCNIQGVRKAINIPREQIRMLDEHRYTVKQFVEIKTKTGDWLLSMVGEVKDNGKYYVVLPDGKGATFPESKIRATEMCRDAEEAHPPAASEPSGGAANSSPRSGGDGGASAALLQQKDATIQHLKERIAQLESGGSAPAPASGGSAVDPNLIQQIMEKEKQMEALASELRHLHQQLLSSL